MATSSYQASYTSFSGADIVATINNQVIGELQAISYSVTREKVPIYVMGSPDPMSFSRGKRGIAGSMVFTVFNRDTLSFLKTNDIDHNIYTAYANQHPTGGETTTGGASIVFLTPEDWEREMNTYIGTQTSGVRGFKNVQAYYADEIRPFDVSITLHNEYGNAAKFSLLGCEILNEGSGMSIDDITTEKACTFVARSLTHLTPIFGEGVK